MSNFRRVVSVEIQVFTFFDVFAQVAWVGVLRLRKVAFKFILKNPHRDFRRCSIEENAQIARTIPAIGRGLWQ